MANSQSRKKNRILKKYSKLIGELFEKMKENSLGELCDELDKLKSQMASELEISGVKIEDF